MLRETGGLILLFRSALCVTGREVRWKVGKSRRLVNWQAGKGGRVVRSKDGNVRK